MMPGGKDSMKQPGLGIVATLIAIVLSFVLIRALGPDLFMGWSSYAIMCALPFTIVVGAFWKGEAPRVITTLTQPVRGIVFLVIAAVVAAIVAVIHLYARGGGMSPPLPMAVMTIITSVVTAFFMVLVLGGWPFSLIRNRVVGGIALLVAIYVVNALIFQFLMNFEFASGAPFYQDALEPGGLFSAWDVVTLIVTALAVMFLFLNFDLWPLKQVKALGSGPLFSLVWGLCCFALGWVVFTIGTALSGLPAPTFLVWVPIPFLFGSIIMLQMLGGSVFATLKQPVQGLASAITSAVLGLLLALGYSALMPVLSAAFPAGPQGEFLAELWLANALLAMTFPLLAFFGDYFQLWPLAGEVERDQDVAPAAG
jgi:hypothetical protein